jgi:hypothetical protein
MEDRIAREGTLAHCEQIPNEAQLDIECANARRAQAAIALRLERERRETLERESERKIEALNQRIVERERLAREAARQAVDAEREAYEALWRERAGAGGVPAQGGSEAGAGGESGQSLPADLEPVAAD